jgi:hypothetical protein
MQADGSVRAGGAASAPIRFGAWQVPNSIAERQLPHGFYRCRCSQRRRSDLLWQFRKGFTISVVSLLTSAGSISASKSPILMRLRVASQGQSRMKSTPKSDVVSTVIALMPRLCPVSSAPAAIIPSYQKCLSTNCRNRFIGKPSERPMPPNVSDLRVDGTTAPNRQLHHQSGRA